MSRDRTLLANLAFADPDKQDPLHDLGCQYIARPEVSSLLGLGRPDNKQRPQFEQPISKGQGQYKTTIGFLDVVLPLEVEGKAVEKYSFTSLYRDFQNLAEAERFWRQHHREEMAKQKIDDHSYCLDVLPSCYTGEQRCYRVPLVQYVAKVVWRPRTIFVEVKIAPVSLGDMLRQINLYREYVSADAWVLAAAFAMSSATAEALREHKIWPVHLGKSFRDWAAAQQALPCATNVLSL